MTLSKLLIKSVLKIVGCITLIFVAVALVETYISFTNTAELVDKAQRGDSHSQKVLGYGYETGNQEFYSLGRIGRDERKAIYWYTKSVNGGDNEASYYLARLYERKNTVSDDSLALYWYTKSAKSGNRNAAQRLSLVYTQGSLGQQLDKNKQAHWKKQSLN